MMIGRPRWPSRSAMLSPCREADVGDDRAASLRIVREIHQRDVGLSGHGVLVAIEHPAVQNGRTARPSRPVAAPHLAASEPPRGESASTRGALRHAAARVRASRDALADLKILARAGPVFSSSPLRPSAVIHPGTSAARPPPMTEGIWLYKAPLYSGTSCTWHCGTLLGVGSVGERRRERASERLSFVEPADPVFIRGQTGALGSRRHQLRAAAGFHDEQPGRRCRDLVQEAVSALRSA